MAVISRAGIMSAVAVVPQVDVIPPENIPPLPPTNLQAINIGQNDLDLTWGAGSDTGGSGLAGYDVYQVIGGVDTLLGSTTATTWPVTGLTAQTPYTFRVRSRDGDGNVSPFVSISVSTLGTDSTPPTDPGAIVASNITSSGFKITWPVSTDTESGVAGYDVFGTPFGVDTLVATVTVNTYTFTGLANPDTDYTVRVQAFDGGGNRSNKVSKTVHTLTGADTTPPSVPGNFRVTAHTSSSLTYAWNAATDNVAVTGYELVRGFTVTDLGNVLTTTVGGLTPSTSYTYDVRAYDAAGNRGAGASVTFTTDAPPDTTAPSIPGAPSTTQIGQSSVTLTWGASTDTGGSGLAGYEVMQLISGSLQVVGTTAETSFQVTGLSPSTDYRFRIRAYDNAGNRSTPGVALDVTTNGQSAGGLPYNRQFQLGAGPIRGTGAGANLLAAIDAVNTHNASTGQDRLAGVRRDVSWPTLYSTSSTYANLPTGVDNDADTYISHGTKMYPLCAYTPDVFQQPIDAGTGSCVNGNNFVTLTSALDNGDYVGTSGTPGLSFHGPGVPAGRNITAVDSTRTKVTLNGTVTGGAATKANGLSYTIGGTNTGKDQKMIARCSASNTTTLEPIGEMMRATVASFGNRIDMIEPGNEWNAPAIGVLPYVDLPLQFRNLCHAYVGAKKANPNITVLNPGCVTNLGLNDGTTASHRSLLDYVWFARMRAEARNITLASTDVGGPYTPVTPAGYFAALKSSFSVTSTGPEPFDVCCVHVYQDDPSQVISGTNNVMSHAALIYNTFGGTYPLMFGEQGQRWDPTSTFPLGPYAAGRVYSPDGGADWYQALIDYCHGNIRWNHNQALTGTYGDILSATSGVTLAQRRDAARHVFYPPAFFAIFPADDVPDMAWYRTSGRTYPSSSTNPATVAKWTEAGTARDPVSVLAGSA